MSEIHTGELNRLGQEVIGMTREVLGIIQTHQNEGQVDASLEENPYVMSGKSTKTNVDVIAQLVLVEGLEKAAPGHRIIAEEKDPRKRPTWVVDGVDGSDNLVQRASFGYGTQCALIDNGKVPIAMVGDATTGDIFGYYGNSGVFRIDKDGQRTLIRDVERDTTLKNHKGMRRPPLDLYHSLSQRLLQSKDIGDVEELSGGIGTTMAQLLTDKIGIFALRPHHERPWDAVPAYALCAAAGMIFMTPDETGQGFIPWQPEYLDYTYMRNFDLFVMHRTRVPEFNEAVLRHAS